MNALTITILSILALLICWGYTKSKSWQDVARLTLALVLAPISFATIFYAKSFWNYLFLELPELGYRVGLIIHSLFLFLTVYCTALSFAAWEKDGFCNLNDPLEKGLRNNLVNGLFVALAFWVLVGTIGVEYGAIAGLVIGLSLPLISGCVDEFKEPEPGY